MTSLLETGSRLALLAVLLPGPFASAQGFSASSLGDFDGIAVIEVEGIYDADIPESDERRAAVLQEYYARHADDVDFVYLFSSFDYPMPVVTAAGRQSRALAVYHPVGNDVQGIGRPLFDNSWIYGSDGVLQGYVDAGYLGAMSVLPFEPAFTDTMDVLTHELLHRFGAYVRFDAGGEPSDALLGSTDLGGEARCHWSFLLDSGGSTHYGNRWQDNGDGTFTSLPRNRYLGPLDLYLMGLADASEVPPLLLIDSPGVDRERMPEPYVTLSGTPRSVTVEDIIAVEGPRLPGVAESQKHFRVAFVLVTRPGGFSGQDVQSLVRVAEQWTLWFSALTDGRAQIEVGATALQDLPTNPGVDDPEVEPRTELPSIDDGVAWLQQRQEADGSWQDSALSVERDTAEAVLALGLFESASQERERGAAWFEDREGANADFAARMLLALDAGQGDVTERAGLLASAQNVDGGWGSDLGYASDPLDTALVLRALVESGADTDADLAGAVAYLEQAQQADGGFGIWGSSLVVTAEVLLSLDMSKDIRDAESAMQQAEDWLLAHKRPDGGFGLEQSTAEETAAAALLLARKGVSNALAEAVDYLLGLQAEDGSWLESAYLTSRAVRAVYMATIHPDLYLSPADIAFDPPAVTTLPQAVTLAAMVRNQGLTDVVETTVSLYEGAVDPAFLLESRVIAVPGHGAVQVAFELLVTDSQVRRYYLVLDPENRVAETNEQNNTALKMLFPEASFDLAIAADGLAVSPAEVELFETVQVAVAVRNLGTSDAYAVPLRLALDSPQGAIEIATLTLDLPAGGTVDRSLAWLATTAGESMALRAIVDPDDAFAEVSETNNEASALLTVHPSTQPNLAIDHRDIHVTPDPALQLADASISALVRNSGGGDASGVEIRCFLGVPGSGGALLGSRTLALLPAGDEQVVDFDWPAISDAGEQVIYIAVDPDEAIQEITDDDNDAFVLVDVLSLPDLAVSSSSISLAPPAPREGDQVVVSVEVLNLGEQESSGVLVRVQDEGAAVSEGSLMSVPGLGGASYVFVYDTAGRTGLHTLAVEIDPEDAIREQREDNNEASRTFGVQDADLWLSQEYISPNGDGVQDATCLGFRLESPQTVQVAIVDEQGELARMLGGDELVDCSGGTVEWDGLSELGMVVPDGTYRMEIRDPGHTVLGSLPVEVDNNRSSIIKAFERGALLEANMTCLLPDGYRYIIEDESGIVLHVYSDDPDAPEYPPGLYFVSTGGEEIARLVPWEWNEEYDYSYSDVSLSPVGKVAFSLVKEWNERELWVADVHGGLTMLLGPYESSRTIRWSADGSHVAQAIRLTSGQAELWIAAADGSSVIKVADQPSLSSSYEWAPSGPLVYSAENRLWVVDAIGVEQEIPLPAEPSYTLTWLDGSTVVKRMWDDAAGESFWLIDISGAGQHAELVGFAGSLDDAAARPAGDLLAISYSEDESMSGLAVCDRSGACQSLHEHAIEECGMPVAGPSWSPDGGKIAIMDPCLVHTGPWLADGYLLVFDILTGESFHIQVSEDAYVGPTKSGSSTDLPPALGLGWSSFRWLPDSRSFIGQDEQGLIAYRLDDGSKIQIPMDGTLEGMSPSGRVLYMRRRADPDSICYGRGNFDMWSIRSLLNLTVDLSSRRVDGSIELSGIAADLNFDHHLMEYAKKSEPTAWTRIVPPSGEQVIQDVFATWVPPGDGDYLVRLTAEDKAGNREMDRRRISWGLRTSLTDFQVEREYFSPNGDGVADQAELSFRVLEPVNVDFVIRSQDGQVARRIEKSYAVAGPDLLTWDGRDDAGYLAPDGTYTIEVADLGFDVVLDNSYPEIQGSISRISPADYYLLRCHVSTLVFDEHIDAWRLEYGQGENPSQWYLRKSGSGNVFDSDTEGNRFKRSIDDIGETELGGFVGMKLRIVASDLAGNRSVRDLGYIEDVLVALELIDPGGDSHRLELHRDLEGACRDTLLDPSFARPGVHHVLGISTSRMPILLANAQMWVEGQWISGADLLDPAPGYLMLRWDNSYMDEEAVKALRISTIDVEGTERFSNAVVFQELFSLRAYCIDGVWHGTACQELFDPPCQLVFEIRSQDDPAYPDWTIYLAHDATQGDEIPTGCFALPMPESLVEGARYEIRMRAVSCEGQESTSNAIDFRFPPTCLPMKLGLDVEVSPIATLDCNSLSPGVRVQTKLFNIFYPDIPLYYNDEFILFEGELYSFDMQRLSFFLEDEDEDGEQLLSSIELKRNHFPELDFDTRDWPENQYKLHAVLDCMIDGQERQFKGWDYLLVDRELPEAVLSSPMQGSLVCPSTVEISPGLFVREIEVVGSAQDESSVGYELYYRDCESPSLQEAMTWHIDAPTLPVKPFHIKGGKVSDGIIGRWWVDTIEEPDVALFMIVADGAGNISCTEVEFEIDMLTEVLATSNYRFFSPNGDGRMDELEIDFNVYEPVLLDAFVQDGAEEPEDRKTIRTLVSQQSQPAGADWLIWDGRDENDEVVADGTYFVEIRAEDDCGNVASASIEVVVDDTPPAIAIAHPQPGEPLSVVVEVLGTAQDERFLRYSLSLEGAADPFQIGTQPVQDGPLGVWNTYGLSGPQTLVLEAEDSVGNVSTEQVTVEVVPIEVMISSLEVQPATISPNGDGEADVAELAFTIAAACELALEIRDGAGQTVSAESLGATDPGEHSLTWSGLGQTGLPYPDGPYRVVLRASLASLPDIVQEESLGVAIDTLAPEIALSAPESGACYRDGPDIHGTLTDAHMKSYTIHYRPAAGGQAELATEGVQSRQDHDFGRLSGLADGPYELLAEAVDLAANIKSASIPFVMDGTPPEIRLLAPESGAPVSALQGPVELRLEIEESNPASWALRWVAGEEPSGGWAVAAEGQGAIESVLHWDPAAAPDGAVTLAVAVTDCAGSESEARVLVRVDSSPPEIAVSSPAAGEYLTGPAELTGSVQDANLAWYEAEIGAGLCGQDLSWTRLGRSESQVADGVLAQIAVFGDDGPHCLRVRAQDQAGNPAERTVDVKVDTQPPATPVLSGRVESRTDAVLSWSAPADADLAGYALYRNGHRVSEDLLHAESYTDAGLSEGRYRYAIESVDLAGWRSEPSEDLILSVDLTPPKVAIHAPRDGALVSDLVDIEGQAEGSGDFKRYSVLVGEGAFPAEWTEIRRSPLPVSSGRLAVWDTLWLDEGLYAIRLEAEDLAGNEGAVEIGVTLDNTPPESPVLVFATPSGQDVELGWEANAEPDLAGYLVYRDGRIANADELVVVDPTPLLVSGTSYADQGLPDGQFEYTLVAVDQAGNESQHSNAIQVLIDLRDPRAIIVQPEDLTRFEHELTVIAETEDRDIAQVQFQYTAAAVVDWTDLGAPVTSETLVAYLDPEALGLAYGEHWLRAVATDEGGRTDPSPPHVRIVYTDLDPPVSPEGLSASVQGDDVLLGWEASADPDGDLAGYSVDFLPAGGEWARVTDEPVVETVYTHLDLPDGDHRYRVVAVDIYDNESPPSAEVLARVYAPLLHSPGSPTLDTHVEVTGEAAAPSSLVEFEVESDAGSGSQGSTSADAEGAFAFSAQLEPGENRIRARAVDQQGNQSRYSKQVLVFLDEPPSTPTGFYAVADDHTVYLLWNPNPEPDLAGYRLYRDGAPINPSSALSSGTASASCYDTYAYRAFDDSTSSYWYTPKTYGGSFAPQWWRLDLPSSATVDRVNVDWGWDGSTLCAASAFEVLLRSEGEWISVASISGSAEDYSRIEIDPPVVCDAIRIDISEPLRTDYYSHVRIAELDVYAQKLITFTDFADNNLEDGRYSYRLSAVDTSGFESQPTSPVEVSVGDVEPPAPPEALVALASGSDVALGWQAGAEADLAGYVVYRLDAGTWVRLGAQPADTPAYVDGGLVNGTYTYRVTAFDLAGNESPPSNEASALVAAPLPAAPAGLAATALPQGGAIECCWTPSPDAASGHLLLRGAASGGPYVAVASGLSGPCADDLGLVDGDTYYYVVRAVDAHGNQSPDSNEAWAVPADLLAPEPPVFLWPTVAGRPISVARPEIDLGGTAEPGAVVRLIREEEPIATTAAAAQDETELRPLDWVDFNEPFQADLSPDGARLAYSSYAPGAGQVLSILDLDTGERAGLVLSGMRPRWSPDGDRLGYIYWDDGNYRRVAVLDLSTGLSKPVSSDEGVDEVEFDWFADSIALVSDRAGDWDVWLAPMDGGELERVTEGAAVDTLDAAPAGVLIAFADYYEGLCAVEPGGRTVVLDADLVLGGQLERFSWSPDGSRLAWVSARSGVPELVVRDPWTGEEILLGQDAAQEGGPCWSPDASRIAYAVDESEIMIASADGSSPPGQADSRDRIYSLQWSSRGPLVYALEGELALLHPAGSFRFEGVPLELGANAFSAEAEDGSGNESARAEPVEIVLDRDLLPDLSVVAADIQLYPQSPVAGQQASVAALV
ncbi:MAG: PD40 domain-containing protein, partial [Deltaproteobacteria bacterium]|nr:PD40 domain-containing protein [Deltaproteobacteria bacterium]